MRAQARRQPKSLRPAAAPSAIHPAQPCRIVHVRRLSHVRVVPAEARPIAPRNRRGALWALLQERFEQPPVLRVRQAVRQRRAGCAGGEGPRRAGRAVGVGRQRHPVRIARSNVHARQRARSQSASSELTTGARSHCSFGRGRNIEKASHLVEMRLRSGRPRGTLGSVAPMAAAACAGRWTVFVRDVASRARSASEAASACQQAPAHGPLPAALAFQPPPQRPPAWPLSTAEAGLEDG